MPAARIPRTPGSPQLAWDYPTECKEQEPSADAVLKEMNGYTLARAPPDREFSTPQRRWNDCLRRLALLRRLSRGSGQSRPGPPPRWSGRSGHAFGLGLGLARQPAQYVQSRLGRRTGPPLVRAQAADVMGHRARRMGRPRCRRFRAKEAARLPAGLESFSLPGAG